MTGKNTSVFAIFSNEPDLEYAVAKLKLAGFRNTDISAILPRGNDVKGLGHEKHTKAPEGATTGVTTGAVLGGALGWLVGIGSLAIPGLGALVVAGPIMGALRGLGIGGAVGGVTGALIGMGIPEYEAKRVEGLIKEGKVLVSVHCDDHDWVTKAEDILQKCGGKEVASADEVETSVNEPNDDPLYAHRPMAGRSSDPSASL